MTDISGSIDTLQRFNGEDDREADRVVDRSTVWLPDPLGSDRRTQSQSIAGSTLEATQFPIVGLTLIGSQRAPDHTDARMNATPT
jgi:hypothetical protein